MYNSSYFFCLTSSSGTEGIKDVKNSVAFLALYRGFLCSEPTCLVRDTLYGCVNLGITSSALPYFAGRFGVRTTGLR